MLAPKITAILVLALSVQAYAESPPPLTALPTLPVLAALTPTAAVGLSPTSATQDPGSAQDVTKKAQPKSGSPWIRSYAQMTQVGNLERAGRLSSAQASTLRQNLIAIRHRYGLRRGKPSPGLDADQSNRMEQELALEERRAVDAQQP